MIRRFNSCRPAWLAALAFALALPPAAAAQAQPTQAPAAAAANGYAARPDVRRFAADVAARHGLDER
ncbi:MAG TPA: hypothetical protein VM491_23640, partial [Burkholderiaceae bacterium]|nr:hypothetical protein [Burkholderiaceae bacterium]